MATKITKKPALAVTSLAAPARQSGNRVMAATWKVPSALVSTSKKNRAEGLEIIWYLGLPGTDPKMVGTTANEKLTNHSINLDNLTIGSTRYTRNSFYPLSDKALSYVTVEVTPTNKKGKGKAAKATRNFVVPRAPTIDELSFNKENGILSTTVKTDEGVDYAERYDTKYTVTVENTRTGETWDSSDSSSTSTEFELTYDASDYMQLAYNDYIHVTVTAWARGYAGDSAKATRNFYVSYPKQVTIEGIDVPSKDPTEKCTVRINTNSTTEHPVDKVRLDYLVNSTAEYASDVPAEGWTKSSIIDDANCTALSVPVADVKPEKGKYTWVRVTSWHAHEEVLFRYSDYMRITGLEEPAATATDDDIVILSADAGTDGRSAVVHLGWNADGQDDSTATELSWSDEEDTWKSTESPSEYTFSWSDGEVYYDGVQYHDSATITIKGLTEATKYYIKARRVLEGDTTTYSDYSDTATCLTSARPESIVAISDRYVSTGNSLNVRWTFSGNGLQKSWQIVKRVEDQGEWVDDVIIASGDGSIGSTQISAERLSDFADNGNLTFNVQASTGSGYVVSENHTVTIYDTPTLEVLLPSLLTAQPVSFTAVASSLCDLIVIVTSDGATGQFPQGILMQSAGDTIHSNIYAPEWGVNNSAVVTLPGGLDFWNLGKYKLSVTAVDRISGLRSPTVEMPFGVEWTKEAVNPEEAVTLTVIDSKDEDGDHTQAVEITLTPPEGSSETDVYDIYRMDVENPSLIGQSFPLMHTVVDEYAPFGEGDLYYRIAIRTIDGDVEFADIDYEAPCDYMRFDWAAGSLELPYGLTFGETFKKDVDIRQHMDGSSDGYWNKNIERTSSLSSDVIKIVQPRDVERARMLARHAGPVFVRLPNGAAFEADVQVTDLSKKNDAVVAIALDATEVGLTDEFLLPVPFELKEEDGQ